MSANGTLWAVRMPGGPTKIVRSAKPISEARAKKAYRESLPKSVASVADRDKSIEWPLCELIDDQTLQNKYQNFLSPHSVTGRSQWVVELT
jgi:hypothetical protein